MYEPREGQDLTGDGDVEDIVQQVHDLPTGATFNTGPPVRPNDFLLREIAFDDGVLALRALEPRQGQDLNDDGDMDDFVLHVVRLP